MSRKAQKVVRDRRAEAAAFDKAVGARIRDRRKAMKPPMFQDELGERIGFTGAQVSRYENGLATCEPHTLALIAKELKCKVSDFTDGIGV